MRFLIIFILTVLIGFGMYYGYKEYISPSRSSSHNRPKPVVISVTPAQSHFTIKNPPSDSLKGTIELLSGQVKWQSRIATEPATITTVQSIQQGEELETGDDGTVTVTFPKEIDLLLDNNTTLGFVQTLPANIVLAQTSGSIKYTKIGTVPVTIRSKHVLIDLSKGEAIISLAKDEPTLKIVVEEGSAILAYNDYQLVSQKVTVAAGETVVYNDQSRSVE